MNDFYEIKDNSIRINLLIVPKSSKNQIAGIINNKLKIKIKSPPVEGAANKELIKFFSKFLKISKSSISIISGEHSKNKIIELSGVTGDKWNKFLSDIKEVI